MQPNLEPWVALTAVDSSLLKMSLALGAGARQLPAALEGFAAAKTGQEALSPGRPRAPKLFFGGLGGIVESWSERRG